MKIAFFTAGTTGAGHLVRGLALQRGLERAGFTGQYRMFGPALPFAPARSGVYETVEIRDDESLREEHRAGESDLAMRLRRYRPDLLLVDLFWAPLRWILPTLDAERWLLLRTCPPAWLVGPPRVPFEAGLFRRVIGIEPMDYRAVREAVDPVVIANPDECRSRSEVRERFNVPEGLPLAVLTHAGKPGEALDLDSSGASDHHLVRLDLFDESPLFPAAPWLGGADLIISGAGYNSFWEARWLGYSERCLFTAFSRRIDNQAHRLQAFRETPMAENGADTLARWILG